MSHITEQYESYYEPTRAPPQGRRDNKESNMGHITDQYGPYYQPIWAILLSHKTYKTYKSHTPYKSDRQFLPLWGIERGNGSRCVSAQFVFSSAY